MTTLIEMYDQLAVALTGDPQLLLACAVATFDPLWSEFDEDEIDYEANPLHIALAVTRGAFPDIYAEAVEQLRRGSPYEEMDRLICEAITAKGIPVDELEMMGWGVPLISFGVDLEDPEFYGVHTGALPALVPFGINIPEGDIYSVDAPQGLYSVGQAVAASLHEQDDPMLRQVGWLYAWLFACSGNTLVDSTDEGLYELQPLSWSIGDVTFAIEMIEEADGVMRDAMEGLRHLAQYPELLPALERNITDLYNRLKKKGDLDDRTGLEWPRSDSSID